MLLFCCRKRLAELPRRFAWYPGSDKRSAAFKAKFRDAEELGTAVEGGETSAGFLPWIFKSGLTPDEVGAASAVAGKQLKTVSFSGLWINRASVYLAYHRQEHPNSRFSGEHDSVAHYSMETHIMASGSHAG